MTPDPDDEPLEQAHETLLQMFYALPVGVLCLDHRGEVHMINPQAAMLLQSVGLSPAPADGLALLQALAPALAGAVQARWWTTGPVGAGAVSATRDTRGQPMPLRLQATIVNPGQLMLTIDRAAPPADAGAG